MNIYGCIYIYVCVCMHALVYCMYVTVNVVPIGAVLQSIEYRGIRFVVKYLKHS